MQKIIITILLVVIIGFLAFACFFALNEFPMPVILIFLLLPILCVTLIFLAWGRILSGNSLRDTESRQTAGIEMLPGSVTGFITGLIKKMGYRRRIRRDVERELICHFNDALSDCKADENKDSHAQTLIEQFGDLKLLAKLIRRAKKRCRPIWEKSLIRTAQANVALILIFSLYTWWFVTGKPNITVDYMARLNQIAHHEALDDQNAWPYYQNAIEKYVETNQISDEIYYSTYSWQKHPSLSPKEQQVLDDWITRNEDAWAEYVTAGKKKHFWYDYKSEFTDQNVLNLMSLQLPYLWGMKTLSKLGIWKARRLLQQGDIQQGMDYYLVIARTGRHLQVAPTIIEQLVGIAISNMAHLDILHIVYSRNLSAEQLAYVYDQLTEIYKDKYP